MRNLKKSLNRAFGLYSVISVALMFIIFSVIQSQFILACQQQLNDRASHSRYFSDELDAQFFC